jgi:hypothetical protein
VKPSSFVEHGGTGVPARQRINLGPGEDARRSIVSRTYLINGFWEASAVPPGTNKDAGFSPKALAVYCFGSL